MRTVCFLVALALSSPLLAAPTASRVTWRWEKDSLCALTQKLASSSTPVTVSRSPGSDLTTVGWLVRSPNFFKGHYPDARVTLSNGTTAPARVRVYSAENRRYWVMADVYGRSFVDSIGGASSVAVADGKFGRFEAPVKDLAAAVASLRACEDKYLLGWGIDVKSYWALKSRPRPTVNLGELFDFTDYPGIGMIKLIESRVIAKLNVGSDGRVTECASPGQHEYREFVEAVCKRLMEEAQFTPAFGADSGPVAAPYVTYARFSLAQY